MSERDKAINDILRKHDIHDVTGAGWAAMEDAYEAGRYAGYEKGRENGYDVGYHNATYDNRGAE